MKLIRDLLIVICLMILFAIGVYNISLGIPWLNTLVEQKVSSIEIDFFGELIIYALFTLLPLFVWLLSKRTRKKNDEFIMSGDGGDVALAYDAVSRYVKNILYAINSVDSVKTELDQSKKGIILNLSVKVKADKTLSEIDREIRQRISDGFSKILGLDNIAAINVRFKEIGYKKKMHDQLLTDKKEVDMGELTGMKNLPQLKDNQDEEKQDTI